MQYLAWRVLSGLSQRAEISFMIVGHTKFGPDWVFGLVKQKYRKTKVGCLDDIVKVVEDLAHVNFAQLVGLEDGTVIVKQYDWATYLSSYFKKTAFSGIKSLHHLSFSASEPGIVTVREYCDSEPIKIPILSKNYLNWSPSPTNLPPEIHSEGLSHARQTYLYEKIREFCPPPCRDKVCPQPTATNPSEPANPITCHPLSAPPSKRPCIITPIN